jgi:shikimate kinase
MKSLDYSKLASCSRIIIDGDPGAGKTTLAKKLAKDLETKFISFDNFILENGAPYCEQIRYETLQKVILENPKIIIEGVCAIKKFARIGLQFDCHIFMQRFNGTLGWEIGDYLQANRKEPNSKLTKEVVKYYREFKPFEDPNKPEIYYVLLTNSIT